MSEVLRLSNSEMAAYRRCKRKWWLGTYRRLESKVPPAPGSALSIGDEVHDALAAYYDPERRADPIAFAETAFEKQAREQPILEDAIRKERELVIAMLSGYLEWLEESGADADLKIVGSETMVEVRLAEDINLLSKLDAPVERVSDGAKLALEHKTTGALDQPLVIMKQDTQFLTEHLARFMHAQEAGASAEEAYGTCQGVLVNMLRKVKRTATAKPPFYGRQDVLHNVHELRHHWRHVMAVAREIQATAAVLDTGISHHAVCPPNPTKNCSWDCPFFLVCVMADDGSDFEGALEALYQEHDPLERYAQAVALA